MKTVKKAVAVGGGTLFAWAIAGAAFAQTTTPTVPNTGAGDVWSTLALIGAAVLVMLAGVFYFTKPESSKS